MKIQKSKGGEYEKILINTKCLCLCVDILCSSVFVVSSLKEWQIPILINSKKNNLVYSNVFKLSFGILTNLREL